MDDLWFSKTLEERNVESKLVEDQNPCGKFGEDSILSEFSKNGDGLQFILDESGSKSNDQIDIYSVAVQIENDQETRKANNGEIATDGFEDDVEFFRDKGVVGMEEITEAASLKSDIEMELLVKCNNGANNVDESVAPDVIEDKGNGVATTEEASETIDDPPREIDPGLSLFVEVFGSLDDIYQVEDGQFSNEDMLKDGDSSKEMPRDENGAIGLHNSVDATGEDPQSPDLIPAVSTDENDEMGNFVDEDIGNQKGKFVVGDLVWIKTKTDLWWPGIVSDPLSATKDGGGFEKKGSLLVKYFGNANSVWCFPFHLKHFGQCFDEMVKQNNSRCFYGAVERAANEYGRRVKKEMTCSCFSKGSSVQDSSVCASNANFVAKQKSDDDVCDYSVSQFKPANFLAHVKCLARDGSLPGKIDLMVTQNCLSAFYHSLGHCQLPMHQFRPTDTKDSTQSVERENSNRTVVLRGKINSLDACSGDADDDQRQSSSTLALALIDDKKDSQVEIFGISDSIPINTIDGSQVSGQTVKGSRIKTRSGKGSWSRERKKSKYLSYPYIAPGKGTPTSGQNGTGDPEKASDPGKESNNKNSMKKGPNKSSCGVVDEVCKPEDLNSSSADMLSDLLLTAIDCSVYKERKCSSSVKRFLSCFRRFAFLNHEVAANKDNSAQKPETQSQIEGINKSSDENPSSNAKPKRRKRKKESLPSAGTVMDFTNGSLVSEFQQLSTTDASQMEKVTKKRRKKTVAISNIEGTAQLSVQGLQVSGGNSGVSKGKQGRKKRKLEESSAAIDGCGLLQLQGKCVKFVELLKDVQKVGPNVQMEVPVHVESCSTVQDSQGLNPNKLNSTIPDLNGNVGESGNDHLTDLNNKPKRRRRRKSADVGTDDKVVKKPELSGAILLYFTPGVPLPSIESFLATFGGYGTLKESETRYVSDSTAQVFFVQSSDALRAFRSLQENNPFGQTLVNCRLVYHSAPRNSSIPDLNGNITETGSSAMNNVMTDPISIQSNEEKPKRRRQRKNKLQNEEILGAILLNFKNSGEALPTVESLVATFVGYGAIKESETRFLNDSTAQIVFQHTCNALQAFQSLQQSNPFGAALSGYRFVYHSSAAAAVLPLPSPKPAKNFRIPPPPPRPQFSSPPVKGKGQGLGQGRNKYPAAGLKPNYAADPPDLLTIKQNLEMMKSMLEKAGNNLSPDMRSKLEIEIKGLMQKVNSTVSGCSSSTA